MNFVSRLTAVLLLASSCGTQMNDVIIKTAQGKDALVQFDRVLALRLVPYVGEISIGAISDLDGNSQPTANSWKVTVSRAGANAPLSLFVTQSASNFNGTCPACANIVLNETTRTVQFTGATVTDSNSGATTVLNGTVQYPVPTDTQP